MRRPDIFGILSQAKRDFCEWVHVRRHRKTLPARIAAMRAKERIKVLFVLWDLPMWKTEPLYKAMLAHPRFEPVLGLTLNLEDLPSVSVDKFVKFKSYITQNGYDYTDLTFDIINEINPDLIFYEKPYNDAIDSRLWYMSFTNKLLCQSSYAFNSIESFWSTYIPLYNFISFFFVENKSVCQSFSNRLPKMSNCFRLTGLPFMDDLLRPKSDFRNPWKNATINKKRIIWAPHYSVPQAVVYICYSTFLDVCEIMIEVAEKYKDKVDFAFKPHPLLRSKLIAIWGEEKTNAYFDRWENGENTQLEQGQYLELFKYSDAMIHDCGSFTIEYLYTQNPVMYLVNGLPHVEDLNEFAKGAYNCHYFGSTREDIERFVKNVIDDIDPMKEKRKKYFEENLLPPNNKTACENMIDAILGENGYC